MTNITLVQAVMFTAKMAPESSATPMGTRQVCIDTDDSTMPWHEISNNMAF